MILFPAVKQPGHEASHSSPSSANIKNDYTCTHWYAFTAWCFILHNNFTLTFQHATSWCCVHLTGITACEVEKFQGGSFSHLRTILKFRGSNTRNLEGM